MEWIRRVQSASAQRTSPRFDSLGLQFRNKLNVFVAAAGQIHDNCVVLGQFACDTNGRQNSVRCFERGNDSLQFGTKSKSFERLSVSRPNVFGSPTIMEKCVLGADC